MGRPSLVTWPLTAYTLAFVKFFADIPGAAISLGEVAPAAIVEAERVAAPIAR